jgi:methanogenic corrinoid protein MtbC1
MISETLFDEYLKALLAADRYHCQHVVRELLSSNIDIKILYLELIQRSMYRVGELWEHNRISVATEHLATAITESLLPLIYPTLFGREHLESIALITCVPNEYHQIGAHIVTDFFELNGWHGHSLGANTPRKDLLSALNELRPDVLGFSVSMTFNIPTLIEILESIPINFPRLDIIIGGRAFQGLSSGEFCPVALERRFPNIRYLATLDDLEAMLTNAE